MRDQGAPARTADGEDLDDWTNERVARQRALRAAVPPSSTCSRRTFCSWMRVRSSVSSCQLCTAQKVPTAVRKVTWRAPKNMSVSFERSVIAR